MHPGKGSLVPGSHADVTVLDPRGVTRTSTSDHHMKVDHSVFESLNLRGSVHSVFLRGQRLVHKGQWVGPENDGLIDSAARTDADFRLKHRVAPVRQSLVGVLAYLLHEAERPGEVHAPDTRPEPRARGGSGVPDVTASYDPGSLPHQLP
jgi:hypothetical protein